MKHLLPRISPLILAVVACLWCSSTSAQSIDDFSQLTAIEDDIESVAINTPIWLAQHLPATMGIGAAGSGLDLTEGFGFSLGLMPARLGVFNQFDTVAEDMELFDLQELLPPIMVWPQFGGNIGIGIGGVELSADVQFIPTMSTTLLDEAEVEIGLYSISGMLRWRINKPNGLLPAFIIGVGGGYYKGDMTIAFSRAEAFDVTQALPAGLPSFGGQQAQLSGNYTVNAETNMAWELYQVSPELRMAWDAGIFKPYLGCALGITFGEVSSGYNYQGEVRLETAQVGGTQLPDLSPVIDALDPSGTLQSTGTNVYGLNGEQDTFYATDPARYTLRPYVGFDLDFGLISITTHVDFAVMTSDPSELGNAVQDVTTSANFLESGSQTSVAVVATVGLRFVFGGDDEDKEPEEEEAFDPEDELEESAEALEAFQAGVESEGEEESDETSDVEEESDETAEVTTEERDINESQPEDEEPTEAETSDDEQPETESAPEQV